MGRQPLVAWMLLTLLFLGTCGWAPLRLLWAQEGALSVEQEIIEQRQRATSGGSQAQQPPPPPPRVVYEGEAGTEQGDKSRWGNMNCYALYLALAVPTAYFVFRGAAR